MTQFLTIPSSYRQIDDLIDLTDGYILSIKNLSVNSNFYINDLKVIEKLKKQGKVVYISLNKNMFNSDLPLLENTLKKLNNTNIDGLFYYDISVLSLVKKLNLNISLIWAEEHKTTNYLTIDYYKQKGIKGIYVSSEITLNEILEIRNKTNLKMFVSLFGYLPMFNSKRHIIKNYLDYFNLKDDSKINYLYKENNYYPATDDEIGTTVYNCNILNGLEEYLILKENNIDYVILNSFNIDEDKFKKVHSLFKEVNKKNIKEKNKQIKKMFNNLDKGFLYKETIYKVKKNEK